MCASVVFSAVKEFTRVIKKEIDSIFKNIGKAESSPPISNALARFELRTARIERPVCHQKPGIEWKRKSLSKNVKSQGIRGHFMNNKSSLHGDMNDIMSDRRERLVSTRNGSLRLGLVIGDSGPKLPD